MSTKATIAYSDEFHFYNEVFDNQHVYLQLTGVEFEAGKNHVMVPIPMHVWEVIRTLGVPDLSLAGKTDDEIQLLAEHQVDDHIAYYEEHKDSEFIRGFHTGATRPRDEQVAETLKELIEERNEQREICEAVEVIRNWKPPDRLPLETILGSN